MSHVALGRIGRLLEPNEIGNPALLPAGATRFNRGALQLAHQGARVLIDHDGERPVGHVVQLAEHPDVDGVWLVALLRLDDSPSWLHGVNPVSAGYNVLQEQELGQARRVLRGILREISLLSPGTEAGIPGARLLTLDTSTPSTPTTGPPPSALAPGIRRRVTGTVLHVR